MSFDLASITVGTPPKPPRLVIYGQYGVGKTTFAASAPNPIVLRTEDGLGTLAVPTFPERATQYQDVIDALTVLITQEHPFQTFVLDTLDGVEQLIWEEIASANGVKHISDIEFGRGYLLADEKWTELLTGFDALRDRGMVVILLAHAEIKRFDAPDAAPYDRYQIKLHKRAAGAVQAWPDVIGCLRFEVFTETTDVGFRKKVTRGVGAGARVLAVEERPAYYAKNRYHMPPEISLPMAGGFGVVVEHIARALPLTLGTTWGRLAEVERATAERAPIAAAPVPAADDPALGAAIADGLTTADDPHAAPMPFDPPAITEPSDEEYEDVLASAARSEAAHGVAQ